MGELSPGSTDRRWIPEGGLRKHREKIHRESKFADDHKNLPFKFSKPQKGKKHELFRCMECGNVIYAPVNTIMAVCRKCNRAVKTERISDE